ncbi:MAG: acyl-CoA dehydrogenase [Janthinobacterium lividum]
MSYRAPLKDMLFVMNELARLSEVCELPTCEEATPELAQAVLEEAARFAENVVAPLNQTGDKSPAEWRDGAVTTTPGFAAAFAQFVTGGWQGVQHPQAYGGQGLPKLIATPCIEMLNAANLSFALCPLLTDGAIEALLTAGSPALQQRYVPKLVSGAWTGTMNLTEPQAGSDLALLNTRAVPAEDGAFKLFGTKIYITYGEHDLAENIVHLVLARLPDAPAGVKGISLFVVPKYLSAADGSLGARNDVRCLSLEHKLGIKASPTAVLQYGDQGGATGYLVGEAHHGLEYMFVMMNAARFAVGVQGIALADRAYQRALAYARERVQSRPVDGSAKQSVTIVHHPDVIRMLSSMRAQTEAARALAYVAAAASDLARGAGELAMRERYQAEYEFLVPIVKGWSTEMAVEVTSLGVQVHGGAGYIEETGAAQHYRDARILTIYEGTTAIQANDLVGRKTLRDGGKVVRALLQRVGETERELAGHAQDDDLSAILPQLRAARQAFESVVSFVLERASSDPNAVFAGAVPYLKLAGIVLGGWQMARAALLSRARTEQDGDFHSAKIATARFFAEHVLSQAPGLCIAITSARGDQGVLALNPATL